MISSTFCCRYWLLQNDNSCFQLLLAVDGAPAIVAAAAVVVMVAAVTVTAFARGGDVFLDVNCFNAHLFRCYSTRNYHVL